MPALSRISIQQKRGRSDFGLNSMTMSPVCYSGPRCKKLIFEIAAAQRNRIIIKSCRIKTRRHQWAVLRTGIPWAVRLSWVVNAYSCSLFRGAILTHKVRETGLKWA